jgi:hypothetical protein
VVKRTVVCAVAPAAVSAVVIDAGGPDAVSAVVVAYVV